MKIEEIKNKKVLIFGLGLLGGGLEAVKWFYKNGAILRITDLKKYKELKPTIDKLEKFIKKHTDKENKNRIKYILGKHRKEDIDWADIIYINPGVSYKNEFVKYALSKNKEVVNDCYLFFKYAKGDIIAVTGTRGKTTTTTWIYELLKNANLRKVINEKNILLGGNQPDKSLFKILDKTNKNSVSAVELSSFQLEFYKNTKLHRTYIELHRTDTENSLKAPKIAIITCLLRDHLNRYENMEEYAKAKANIFMNQTKDDYLILNYDNNWTKFFLRLKPASQIYFVSLKPLPKNLRGAFIKNNYLIIRDKKENKLLFLKNFKEIYGEHNLYNLLFAVLADYLYIKENKQILTRFIKNLNKLIFKLKTPKFRQEIIYKSKKLLIINDSAATTPDATIAGIRRFYSNNKKEQKLILITGGTDKNLDFKELAQEIKRKIKPENLFLLDGSATKKLIKELEKINYEIIKENVFENFKKLVSKVLDKVINPTTLSIVIFSPGAASFEKFKNEFDRGSQFNKLIRQILRQA